VWLLAAFVSEPEVFIRVLGHNQCHNVNASLLHRKMQWSVVECIPRELVCPIGQKKLHNGRSVLLTCHVKGCPSILCFGLNFSISLEQGCGNFEEAILASDLKGGQVCGGHSVNVCGEVLLETLVQKFFHFLKVIALYLLHKFFIALPFD